MNRVDDACRRVSQLFGVIAALSVATMMASMTFDVVTRAFLNIAVQGIYELVQTLVVVIAFMGLAYTERARATVRVTLITERMPPRVRSAFTGVGSLVAALTAAWLAYAFWGNALDSFNRGESSQGIVQFVLWPARFAAALGMTMVAVEFLLTARSSFGRSASDPRTVQALDTQKGKSA